MLLVRHIRRTPYESAAAPTSHSATDPAEFNVVCRTKPNLPNQTDSNAALLPYLTHQLGWPLEWSDVWKGPPTLKDHSQLTPKYSFDYINFLVFLITTAKKYRSFSMNFQGKIDHLHGFDGGIAKNGTN